MDVKIKNCDETSNTNFVEQDFFFHERLLIPKKKQNL